MSKVGINIVFMRRENDIWIQPAEVPFKSKYGTGDPTFSPDGKKLFFTSRESIDGKRKDDKENIWYVERQNGNWGKPKPLSPVVNSYPLHWQLSVAANGNLYFGTSVNIYLAIPENGKYGMVEKLDPSINSEHDNCTPFIAPDESYLIFSRIRDRADLFISFKKEDGTWTKAKNMGPTINTDLHELCPNVTPDGKYLFFNRNYGENGELRVFWVSAEIIDELKPDELKNGGKNHDRE
jgi:Tol biopolymer transport system component